MKNTGVIGVLALQGAFAEHIKILRKLGVNTIEVRLPHDLENIQGLILPGGESTTICRLMQEWKLRDPIIAKAKKGMPIWGTCAGAILLAKIVANFKLQGLQLMDITIERNAFGRQIDSFDEELNCLVLGTKPFSAVFIRAPIITQAGKAVEILTRLQDGTIVAAQQDKLLATSFHPELTNDYRWHEYFISSTL